MPYPSHVMGTVGAGLPRGGGGAKPGSLEFLLSPVWIIPGVALVSTRRWRHIDVMLLPPSVHCTGGGSAKEPQTGWSMRLKGKRQIMSLSVLILMSFTDVQFGARQETYCINYWRLAPYMWLINRDSRNQAQPVHNQGPNAQRPRKTFIKKLTVQPMRQLPSPCLLHPRAILRLTGRIFTIFRFSCFILNL